MNKITDSNWKHGCRWAALVLAAWTLVFDRATAAQEATPVEEEEVTAEIASPIEQERALLMEGRLERLAEAAASWTGPWIESPVVYGISWLQILLSLFVLGLVALLDLLVRKLLRRKIAEEKEAEDSAELEHEKETRHWLALTLHAAIPPLGVLVWIYGFYLASYILLVHIRAEPYPYLIIAVLDTVWRVGVFIIFFWFLFRMVNVVDVQLKKIAAATEGTWDDMLFPLVGKALRLLVPLLAFHMALPAIPLSPEAGELAGNAASLLLIGAVAFMLFQLVTALAEAMLGRYRTDVADNLAARKIHTQVLVLKKVAFVIIGLFALASMLMVFEAVRQLGTSILASAGIAGIIIGFAAQRSIATLLAGFQIAITQPIRIDDVVIVENEWGRIEEITLTYVVVRIWDLRRLILPINYFIEKPFQNWTRVSADILGTVFLYVDYSVPLRKVREELTRILNESPCWDRKVDVLQVTDFKEHVLEVRALASARDASLAWDLRCEIREKMLEFIRSNYPESLPRFRAEWQNPVMDGPPKREMR